MNPAEFKSARETYCYVPARLIRAHDHESPDFHWKSLDLVMDVPDNWAAKYGDARSKYSSIALDEFHRELLRSKDENDLLHGLMSVVFWGFASGTDGRINARRALSRSNSILQGRSNTQSLES